jgi:hypothetical protein
LAVVFFVYIGIGLAEMAFKSCLRSEKKKQHNIAAFFSFIYTCVVNNKKGLNGKYRWLRHQKSARSQHP